MECIFGQFLQLIGADIQSDQVVEPFQVFRKDRYFIVRYIQFLDLKGIENFTVIFILVRWIKEFIVDVNVRNHDMCRPMLFISGFVYNILQ